MSTENLDYGEIEMHVISILRRLSCNSSEPHYSMTARKIIMDSERNLANRVEDDEDDDYFPDMRSRFVVLSTFRKLFAELPKDV